MALFKGATPKANPLLIQVTAAEEIPIYVRGFYAVGLTTAGATSRPILTRPSTPGTGSGEAFSIAPSPPDHGADTSRDATASVVTDFITAPSLPEVNLGSFSLPIRVRWEAPHRGAIMVPGGGSIVLYAAVAGDHAWSGEVTWEER